MATPRIVIVISDGEVKTIVSDVHLDVITVNWGYQSPEEVYFDDAPDVVGGGYVEKLLDDVYEDLLDEFCERCKNYVNTIKGKVCTLRKDVMNCDKYAEW